MTGITQKLVVALAVSLVAALLLAACGGGPSSPSAAQQADTSAEETQHMQAHEHDDEHAHDADEHMSAMGHDVPEEADAMLNPIQADDESLAAGAALYAANCVVCHGETGQGDGPTAKELEKKPADLHADHVQDNSDGALFHIISHGRPDTPMPAWEDVLSEEERWHVVNFLRTFGE